MRNLFPFFFPHLWGFYLTVNSFEEMSRSEAYARVKINGQRYVRRFSFARVMDELHCLIIEQSNVDEENKYIECDASSKMTSSCYYISKQHNVEQRFVAI